MSIVLSSLLFACDNASQRSPTTTVTPSLAPPTSASWAHRVVLLRDLAYGDDPQQVLDVYLQGTWTGEPTFFERAPEARPTLLWIHGGGWVARDRRPEPFVLPFLEQGWHVVSITYRLGPGTAPAAVDDGVCALAWLVANAEEYGFDVDKVVAAGVSAGGHLSLTTGILGSRAGHECSPGDGFRVHSVINWFGITDIQAVKDFLDTTDLEFGNYALSWIGEESRVREISAAYSPVHLLGADSPPVLTIHGTADAVVPYHQALVLHERLRALGIRNELLSLQGGTHAGFSEAQYRESFAAMLEFVDAAR